MNQNTPIVIGGVGGSGTRLIAQILMDLGYHMGNELNESMDNMWFMFLFKRCDILGLSDIEFKKTLDILISTLSKKGTLCKKQIELVNQIAEIDRNFYSKQGFRKLASSIINNVNTKTIKKWGWKEPNSHIVIKQLRKSLPNMKFVHVIRNGLDMAFSKNQNQLILWGSQFINGKFKITPKDSLRFWCLVHKELLKFSKTMKQDFYLLNFDDFCHNPNEGLEKLSHFLQVNLSPVQQKHILSLVNPLNSVGRYKSHELSIFNKSDLDYVKQLGFETE